MEHIRGVVGDSTTLEESYHKELYGYCISYRKFRSAPSTFYFRYTLLALLNKYFTDINRT